MKPLLMVVLAAFASVPGPSPEVERPEVSKINILGPIDTLSAVAFIAQLDSTPKEQMIVVEIDSGGGEFDAGFQMIKAIERHGQNMICVVDGEAASMAFAILQACPVRLATDRSRLMFHSVTIVAPINQSNLTAIKLVALYNTSMVNMCVKRMKVTKDFLWEKLGQGDWWMGPEEALEVGAVDAIVE
jgi:ATP-dependent protease ClpP protease subunit